MGAAASRALVPSRGWAFRLALLQRTQPIRAALRYAEGVMRCLLVLLCLSVPAAVAQKDAAAGLQQQVKTLRSLPDDVRASATRKLALEIRALPPGAGKVTLAVALSNYSTEGDFGRATLQDVATTLAGAIRETHAPDAAFAELARLAHYEHVDASLDDPKFAAAMKE